MIKPKSNQQPIFSIIIPSLNEETALPRLLEDLTQQTNQKFEVIHVDGQSEDNTCKLAQKFASKLPSFKQIISPIRHVSHQRNLGAKVATGTYLLFLDADSQIPPYFLEGISYQIHRQPVDLFTTWLKADSDRTADKAIVTSINLSLDISNSLDAPFALGTIIGASPKAFKKIGGFREDVKFAEDEDFIRTGHKLNLSFAIYRHPRLIMDLRRFRHEGSLTTLQQIATKRLSIITSKSHQILKPRDYAMGGHVFRDNSAGKTAFIRLDNVIRQFARKPKLKQALKDLITFQELEDPNQ